MVGRRVGVYRGGGILMGMSRGAVPAGTLGQETYCIVFFLPDKAWVRPNHTCIRSWFDRLLFQTLSALLAGQRPETGR